MCGICGIVGLSEARDVVERMNAKLTHRGPDHQAVFHERDLALGISRLAILDVEGGNQPMFNEDESVVTVHNGEIYNFRELRDDLIAKGHSFGSTTDSEVLVHAYEQWGTGMVERLEGMFAFCIWDRKARRLLLARDRFGEKPLFFHRRSDGLLAFGSELASLLAYRGIERRPHREALGYYLRVGFVPEPLTAFAGVESLPPGHTLVWEEGGVTIRAYYRPAFRPDPTLDDDRVAAEACAEALDRAVRRQMVSDVPLGAFLSGGIDSSSVVASMVQHASEAVKTFTVRFEDQAYDESAIARKTAERLGTDHHEIVVPNAAFDATDLHRIVDHVGQPFYDSSGIPTYVLCEQVRKHVTVALTGDGGDEMFAGYPFFDWARTVQRLTNLPQPLLVAGAKATRRLASTKLLRHRGELRQVRRAVEAASGSAEEVPARVLSLFDPPEIAALVRDNDIHAAGSGELGLLTALPDEAVHWSPLRRLMYYRLRNNLPRDMLTKIDSMSMACSLELRAPMLDVGVAEIASRLPDRQLRRAGKGKLVLRNAMKDRLPREVFETPKSGFSVPLHRYMNDAFHQLAHDVLSPSGPLGGIFEGRELDRIRDRAKDILADRADVSVYRASHQLWSLVVLGTWMERFEVAA